jgi:CheY-like chemotaxis protein
MARILVVDDQPEVAELVQAVLKDEGHAADAVYSGQAALDRLTQTVYDLVVCDVRIPGRRREGGLPSRRAAGALRGRSCCS